MGFGSRDRSDQNLNLYSFFETKKQRNIFAAGKSFKKGQKILTRQGQKAKVGQMLQMKIRYYKRC